jgi:hypothetical protein
LGDAPSDLAPIRGTDYTLNTFVFIWCRHPLALDLIPSNSGWLLLQRLQAAPMDEWAALRGRPRILVPVRLYRISTYRRNELTVKMVATENPDRYGCTAVQLCLALLESHESRRTQ